jgi:hypothetical protein
MLDDVNAALSSVEDVNVNVFYRNIDGPYSIIYVRFNYDGRINYIRRFLDGNIIDNVINNILLSMNTIDSNGKILKELA